MLITIELALHCTSESALEAWAVAGGGEVITSAAPEDELITALHL